MGRPATRDGTVMDLRLYDTLTKEKRSFVPIDADAGEVI